MVEERRASYLHTVPFSLLNERSLGQSSGVTRRVGGRGKSDDWSSGCLRQKGHHGFEKFEGEFYFGQKPVLEQHAEFSRLQEGLSP